MWKSCTSPLPPGPNLLGVRHASPILLRGSREDEEGGTTLTRSAKEQELVEKAARYLPGASTGNMAVGREQPFILKEGRGSRVWDVASTEYIDYLMGSGPLVLGHAHTAVVAAVVEAVERGSTFFATSEKAVLLAEEIVKAVPCADKVRFATSGTDACFQCLRIARSFRRRDKILKFEGGYHGSSDYAVMSVAPGPNGLRDFPEPVRGSGGVPQAISDTVLIAPYNDADSSTAIIEKHHDELAAVIVEPMQRILSPEPGFPPVATGGHVPLPDPPHLRRSGYRLPTGLRRGPGVLWSHPRPDSPWQDSGRGISPGGGSWQG